MTTDPTTRQSLFTWLTQVSWLLGTLGASIIGLTSGSVLGLGLLAGTVALTVVCAWQVVRWRAFAVVFTALLLQACAGWVLGFEDLNQHLGLRFFWMSMTNAPRAADVVIAFLPAFGAAAFIGPLLHSRRALGLVRRVAPVALPAALVVSTALIGLGVRRSLQYPLADRYFDSLPAVATLPGWDGACESIEESARTKEKTCFSPRYSAGDFSISFACRKYDDERYRSCESTISGPFGEDTDSWYRDTGAQEIARDDALGTLLVRTEHRFVRRLESARENRVGVRLHDIRDRIAPPREWLAAASAGWALAIACALTIHFLRRLFPRPTEAHRRWLATARGDLAIVGLATLVTTNVFLAVALWFGFLF